MPSDIFELWGAMKSTSYQRTLNDLDKILSQDENFLVLLKKSLEKISNVLRCEAYTFWIYQLNDNGLIKPLVFTGGSDISDVRLFPNEGIVGKVISTGKGVIIEDCSKEKAFNANVDRKSGFTTKSMICVPTISHGVTFGCIEIINRKDDSYFDDEDFEMVTNIAGKFSELLGKYNLLQSYFGYDFSQTEEEKTYTAENRDIAMAIINAQGFEDLILKVSDETLASVQSSLITYVKNIANKYHGNIANVFSNRIEVIFNLHGDDKDYIYHAAQFAMDAYNNIDELKESVDKKYGIETNLNIYVSNGRAYTSHIFSNYEAIGRDVYFARHANGEVLKAKRKGYVCLSEDFYDNLRTNHRLHVDKFTIPDGDLDFRVLELKTIEN